MGSPSAPQEHVCRGCGLSHAPALLSCPRCHALTHAPLLEQLAAQARAADEAADVTTALTTWREVLSLVPEGTAQHRQVGATVAALTKRAPDVTLPAQAPQAPDPRPQDDKPSAGLLNKLGWLGGAALLLWKFKAIILIVLSKGKWLLLGLTKGKTLFSMVAFAGVYWAVFGWKFAVGLVVGIYIHEMGHVAALKKLGIAASPPMFIPGVGALVRMKQYPATEAEDAQVGLAGPIWGAAATVAFYLAYLLWDAPAFAAIARFNAWINLFNLLPFGPLDGSRGMNAMSRVQRWICVATLGLAYLATNDGLILLIGLVGAYRAGLGTPAKKPDPQAMRVYVMLVIGLTAFSQVGVPGLPT